MSLPERMGSFPLAWFEDKLHHSLKTRVRPVTALTRRRLLKVSVPMPRESFKVFMEPVKDDDTPGLVRGADGETTPTKTGATCGRYNYIVVFSWYQ